MHLTRIDGIEVMVAQTLISEVGFDMGAVEIRGALRFMVGTLPRPPYQLGQGVKPGHAARSQPRCYSTADRGHNPTAKADLARRAVPTHARQTRCTESHHGYGTPPRPTRLSNVEIRSTIVDKVLRTTSRETAINSGFMRSDEASNGTPPIA